MLAKAKGLDPTIFERMISQRDEKVIEATDDEDEGEFALEAMAAQLIADESSEAAEEEADSTGVFQPANAPS